MSFELLFMVYSFFRSHRGLYYWSIVVAAAAMILQITGFILQRFENYWPPILPFVMSKVGWAVNVTAFSLVLWSRLHLVVDNPRILKWVLVMIIASAVLCIGSTTIFEFGLAQSGYRNTFYPAIGVVERFQQTMYTLQEAGLSILYVHYSARFWQSGMSIHTRKVVGLLTFVQILSMTLDIILTVTVYLNMLILRCTLYPFFYALKLKLEFLVLNQLRDMLLQRPVDLTSGAIQNALRPPIAMAQAGRSDLEAGLCEMTSSDAPSLQSMSPKNDVKLER